MTPGSTTSYWVAVTDSEATPVTTYSITATITVNPALGISTQPASTTIYYGQSDTLSVTPSGGTTPYHYQWYIGSSGITTSPIGTDSSTLTVSPTSTTSYWVQVTDSAAGTPPAASVNSSTAIVTLNPVLTNTITVRASATRRRLPCRDRGTTWTAANLRSAVMGADALGGSDQIVFDPSLFSTNAQTIDLTMVGDTSVGNSALQITRCQHYDHRSEWQLRSHPRCGPRRADEDAAFRCDEHRQPDPGKPDAQRRRRPGVRRRQRLPPAAAAVPAWAARSSTRAR